ncbi:uncharacterized protein A4U43_C07F25520 [Asparagus officinalis]|uniref:Uncharacterized protein n=1 Tax=Asparagus officinalis TaxID=4686 RepID=A0A5P1EEV4_ASPOF|nr:uncharacterized protein A4U43_C07F25520 [Asparagus officinalis]
MENETIDQWELCLMARRTLPSGRRSAWDRRRDSSGRGLALGGKEDVGDGEDLVGAVVGELGVGVKRSRACSAKRLEVGSKRSRTRG